MASYDELRARAFRLRRDGLSYQRIAETVGVNRGTVYRWCKKHYAAWLAAQGGSASVDATHGPEGPQATPGGPRRAGARQTPPPPPPGSDGPQAAAQGPTAEDAHFTRFLTALQATARYDVAAAVAEVDPATIARWRVERARELERARATVVLRNARILHTIAGSTDATNRDRIAAVDRLLQWTSQDGPSGEAAAVGPTEPAVPLLTPDGPSDAHAPGCAEACTGRCPAARWQAWVTRVCWARAHPAATDAVALLGAGALVGPADAGEWLEQGRAELSAGDDTPAARFATRWATAVGASISAALVAHASALSAGQGAATRAALDTLAAIAPDEYGGRGDPRRLTTGADAEQPVARILRLSFGDARPLDAPSSAAENSS